MTEQSSWTGTSQDFLLSNVTRFTEEWEYHIVLWSLLARKRPYNKAEEHFPKNCAKTSYSTADFCFSKACAKKALQQDRRPFAEWSLPRRPQSWIMKRTQSKYWKLSQRKPCQKSFAKNRMTRRACANFAQTHNNFWRGFKWRKCRNQNCIMVKTKIKTA